MGGSPYKKLKVGQVAANLGCLFVLCLLKDKHTIALVPSWADATREQNNKAGPPDGHNRESEAYFFEDPDSFVNFALSKGWKEFAKRGSSSTYWRIDTYMIYTS